MSDNRSSPRRNRGGDTPNRSPADEPSVNAEAPKAGRPRSAEAERAILDATVDLIISEGVAGLRMDDIATRASVAKTTIYRRWPDKTALIGDAVLHSRGPIPEPPHGELRADLIFLVKVARKGANERIHKLMHKIWASADRFPELLDMCRKKLSEPRRAVLLKVLEKGIQDRQIREDVDTMVVTELLIGPVFAGSFMRSHRYTDAQVEFVVDVVLLGLTPQTRG